MRSVAWLLLGSSTVAFAQSEPAESIHWAYSAYFGTGRYEIDGGGSVFMLGAGPRKRLRGASLDAEGQRSVGIELRVPVAIGVHRLEVDDLGSTLRFDNVSTLSAVPGVEFEVPVNERWSLKPLVYAGWGTELDGDASALIYWAGLKSSLRFETENFEWALINGLTYLGYSSDAHQHANVLPLLTGFEFGRPLANSQIGDHPVRIHWHVAYTTYLNEIEIGDALADAEARPASIDDEWELGVAFSTAPHPLRLRRLRWDRVGIAYRFSSGGDLEGIGLVFRSLFER